MAFLCPVSDPDDPALEPYARVRERDLAGREGLFVAEGATVVRVLARSRFRVRSLLLEERRVEAMKGVVDALAPSVPVFVAPQRVMDRVVGFEIHRGVLALGERAELAASSVLGNRLAVGLVGLSNHDNVGSIFRSAAAFGADCVLLDRTTCDPLYRKALRVSVGGSLVVPFARVASPLDVVEAFQAAGYETLALTPRGEQRLTDLDRCSTPRAIVFGAEGAGLPDNVLRASARRVRIDATNLLDSLNVAVATGIALYELTA